MFNRTSDYLDASNRGVAERLGDEFTLELRTEEPAAEGLVPQEPHGKLLRAFRVVNAKRRTEPGVMELVGSSVVSLGPRGFVGHVRLVTGDGVAMAEGNVAVGRDPEEFQAAMMNAAIVFRMPTLELVTDQPVEVSSFQIGGPLGEAR
jgi:hypothetical protein